MLKKILQLAENKWYWLAFVCLGITLEAAALYYQYILEYMPCVLCIHIRIWVLAMIITSLVAMMLYRHQKRLLLVQTLMTAVTAGFLERSYQLFGTERGFLFGDCSMDSGLPSWFALDDWLPSVFKVWEPCGYTPELLFGVTMAEALLVLSFILLLINAILTISLLMRVIAKT